MTKCPRCSTLLYRRRVDEVEIDGCPSCGGAFFDRGELRALSRRPDALRRVDAAFPPGLQEPAGREASNRCPRCGEPLVELEHPSVPGVRVDGCHGCKGIWLDHGESAAIADRLDSPAAAPPSPPAQPSIADTVPPRDPTDTRGLPLVRAQRLRQLEPPSSAGGSLGRGVRFFKEAFALAFECPALLSALLLGAVVQVTLVSAWLYWASVALRGKSQGSAMPSNEMSAHWIRAHGGILALGSLACLFLALLASNAIMGMTVSMIDAYLKGREPKLSVAARDVLKNFWAILALTAVGALVELAASLVRDAGKNRGFLAESITSAVASAIDAAWTVLAFLLLPVIMIEDVGLGEALERARRIHRGNLLPIAVGEVGLRALGMAFGLAALGIAGGVAFLRWPLTAPDLIGLVFLLLLVTSVLGIVSGFARGAYYTCLYLWTVEVEKAADPAAACVPGPLASALAARFQA